MPTIQTTIIHELTAGVSTFRSTIVDPPNPDVQLEHVFVDADDTFTIPAFAGSTSPSVMSELVAANQAYQAWQRDIRQKFQIPMAKRLMRKVVFNEAKDAITLKYETTGRSSELVTEAKWRRGQGLLFAAHPEVKTNLGVAIDWAEWLMRLYQAIAIAEGEA